MHAVSLLHYTARTVLLSAQVGLLASFLCISNPPFYIANEQLECQFLTAVSRKETQIKTKGKP
jgi:hypothetical protein